MHVLWYVPIGLLVGTFGTIIGAGGGFILVPLLMLLFPGDAPSVVTAASLAVIFVNAASGTIAYARMKRISYRTGILFALATIPGALAGSYLTGFIPRKTFGLAFGILLVAVAVFLCMTRGRTPPPAQETASPRASNLPLGMGLSLAIGVLSSLAGIGGGLIHVPVLTYLCSLPVHVATATSHFVLVFTSLAGVIMHVIDGSWPVHLARDLCLAAGVVGGAQLGALLARRVPSRWIVLGLAAALGLVGVRLLVEAF
jgi:uncharacterized membrane protein YfcA